MVATDPAMVKLPRVAGQAELLGLLPRQLAELYGCESRVVKPASETRPRRSCAARR